MDTIFDYSIHRQAKHRFSLCFNNITYFPRCITDRVLCFSRKKRRRKIILQGKKTERERELDMYVNASIKIDIGSLDSDWCQVEWQESISFFLLLLSSGFTSLNTFESNLKWLLMHRIGSDRSDRNYGNIFESLFVAVVVSFCHVFFNYISYYWQPAVNISDISNFS